METPPILNPDLVQMCVGNAHRNLSVVQELLAQEPALLNAAYDWGGGDWETALGAAAHTGQREIARFLLAHGARLDIFAAAMLGDLAIVQAILTAHPETMNAPGPHGIPLLVHAVAGGEEAAAVVEYLQSFPSQAVKIA
jgi:hypothetical protein